MIKKPSNYVIQQNKLELWSSFLLAFFKLTKQKKTKQQIIIKKRKENVMNFEKVILWQVGAREEAKRNDKGSKVREKRRARRKAKGTGESVARARSLSRWKENNRERVEGKEC